MTKDTVTNILLDNIQKSGYNLNQILFVSGYSAYEKAPNGGGSRFRVNQCCMYKVTTPGFNGKPDWIEFIKSCDEEKYDLSSDYMRSYAIIMQNALTNAVAYHIGKKTKELDEIHVLETANLFAKGIITGAQELSKFQDPTETDLTNQNKTP